mmetsp:Transcript_21973/g.29931  ORF Transcript_21973/g.29931 Transcript_21973/m.29931 type:complete len:212 (-) Transcript_21973:88-723(-)
MKGHGLAPFEFRFVGKERTKKSSHAPADTRRKVVQDNLRHMPSLASSVFELATELHVRDLKECSRPMWKSRDDHPVALLVLFTENDEMCEVLLRCKATDLLYVELLALVVVRFGKDLKQVSDEEEELLRGLWPSCDHEFGFFRVGEYGGELVPCLVTEDLVILGFYESGIIDSLSLQSFRFFLYGFTSKLASLDGPSLILSTFLALALLFE